MSSSFATPRSQPLASHSHSSQPLRWQSHGLRPSMVPSPRTPPGSPGWLLRDWLLLGAAGVCALLIGYQLIVTLLQPPWIGEITDWLLMILAWIALLVVG